MTKRRLTDAAINRLKPPETGQVEHYDLSLPAFGLRVSHKGSKSFFVMKRVNGRMRRITLGRYKALSLADARQMATDIYGLTAKGLDPKQVEAEREREAEERKREEERQQQLTFRSLAERFIATHVDKHLRPATRREYARVLLGPYTEEWASRPIGEITRSDVNERIERIAAQAPGGIKTVFAYLRKFFNWCVDQEFLDAAPTDRVSLSYRTKKRERVLSEDELAIVWRAFDDEPSLFGPMFKLLLLSGQRRAEVAGMRWGEVRDLDGDNPVWEIPSDRTKNQRPHLVPLAPMAVELLSDQHRTGELVFSTTGATASSGFSKAKARIDAKINAWRSDAGLPELADWRLHDLRRSMVTHMNERLSILPHVVEAVVNHLSGPSKAGVAGTYNRALYLDERRQALEAWSRFVIDLTSASPGGPAS